MRLDVDGRSRYPLGLVPTVVGVGSPTLPEPVPDTAVSLVFDADPSNIRLARLVASGLMVERRFTVDEIEDVRIAVDEVCSVLVAHLEAEAASASTAEGRVALVFDADGEAISVVAATVTTPVVERHLVVVDTPDPTQLDPLTTVILEATVDSHEIAVVEGGLRFSLRKARVAGAPEDGDHEDVR